MLLHCEHAQHAITARRRTEAASDGINRQITGIMKGNAFKRNGRNKDADVGHGWGADAGPPTAVPPTAAPPRPVGLHALPILGVDRTDRTPPAPPPGSRVEGVSSSSSSSSSPCGPCGPCGHYPATTGRQGSWALLSRTTRCRAVEPPGTRSAQWWAGRPGRSAQQQVLAPCSRQLADMWGSWLAARSPYTLCGSRAPASARKRQTGSKIIQSFFLLFFFFFFETNWFLQPTGGILRMSSANEWR